MQLKGVGLLVAQSNRAQRGGEEKWVENGS